MLLGGMKLINRLTKLPVLINLSLIFNRLTMLLVSTEVTRETKMVEEAMLPKMLVMKSAKKVTAMVPYMPKILKLSIKESAKLSAIFKNTKIWVEAGVSITRIPVIEEEV